MKHRQSNLSAIALASLTALAFAAPASAQLAAPSQSQVSPGEQVDRRNSDADINFQIPGGIQPPEGADKVKLTISAVELTGDYDTLPRQELPARLKAGETITVSEAYEAAAELQQRYIDAGYPLVRIFVPVQNLDKSNAKLRLRVISGYIADLDLQGLSPQVRSITERYLRKLVNQRPLTANQLERAVLLAGEVAGLSLSTALAPGKSTGETILIAQGEYKPLNAVLSIDDRLAPELGGEQITASFAVNSLLGLGERIGFTMATTMRDPSFSRSALRRYLGVFVDTPIGANGLSISIDAASSSSRFGQTLSALNLDSEFNHLGIAVNYPLVRKRGMDLLLRAQFDANNDSFRSLALGFPVPLSQDKTRVFRVGVTAARRFDRLNQISLDLEYSRGIDAIGARGLTEASILVPLSRFGADASFDKVHLDLRAQTTATDSPLSARIHGRAQSSLGKAMLRSEQFALTSTDLISGPPSGALVGDAGIAGRFELAVFDFAGKSYLEQYAFMAAGISHLEQPTAMERGRTDIQAAGTGVRTSIPLGESFVLSGQLEFSRTWSNENALNDDWVTFQVALKF